ncbi:MAG: DUF4097 family beta strand repeat protein [Clostridia bacterium]|nr:DUF4097 family beta strand repeat protein [Clostridia bacterium]
MSKGIKIALITAVCLIGVGLILGIVGYAAGGADMFKDEATAEREIVINEAFSDIVINCERSKVVLIPAEDGVCRIIAEESDSLKLTAEVQGGALRIDQKSKSKWNLNLIGFNFFAFKPYKLNIYLPESEYRDLSVNNVSGGVEARSGLAFSNANLETVSGGIRLDSRIRSKASVISVSGGVEAGGFECESIKVNCTSGGIRLSSISCDNADIKCISGGITLTRVIASGELRVETVSGGIVFDCCDGGSIRAEAISGSIRGSLLSAKVFKTDTTSGKISVPEDGDGGVCELETVSGRIEITITE